MQREEKVTLKHIGNDWQIQSKQTQKTTDTQTNYWLVLRAGKTDKPNHMFNKDKKYNTQDESKNTKEK